MRILAVEDDGHLLATVGRILREEGYEVDEAETGDEGLYMAQHGIYDLLVLDIMLPGMSGLDLVRQLRTEGFTIPVLMLTAKDSVEDVVRGLDAGADDYLTKPFEIREFAARARALLRRHGAAEANGNLRYHRLVLNENMRTASVDGHPLELTYKEFELLHFLVRNREQILTREQLCSRVWGLDSEIGFNAVDVYIYYLRRKLKPFRYDCVIQTVRNVGYMLRENRPCSPKPESD